MRRLVVLAALALSAGCFSPTYKVGLACSSANTCPPGQGCNPLGICELHYVREAGADAVAHDAGDAKGSDGAGSDADAPFADAPTSEAGADAAEAGDAAETSDGSGGEAREAGAEAGADAGIPGLIGHWALGDEHTNGQKVPDLATDDGAQDGTIVDTGGFLMTVDDRHGDPNKALFFSADDFVSDDYTYIHVPGITSLPASVTMTAWINQQPGNMEGVIVGINRGPQLYQDEYRATLRVPSSANQYGEIQGLTLVNGTWVFVAGVVAPFGATEWQLQLYANGTLAMSGTVPNAGVTSLGDFVIGGLYNCTQSGCDDGFKGDIDDVRLYDRALTADEIMALYLTP